MGTRKEPWVARKIICRKRVCILKILWGPTSPPRTYKNSYPKLELNQVSQIIRNVTILIAYLSVPGRREKRSSSSTKGSYPSILKDRIVWGREIKSKTFTKKGSKSAKEISSLSHGDSDKPALRPETDESMIPPGRERKRIKMRLSTCKSGKP